MPDGCEVVLFDYKKNQDSDNGEGSSIGMYITEIFNK